MSKSVLVLEENLAIQGLIASSLPPDLLSLHQESDPESFLQQARSLKPDLIFVSNEDRSRGYQTLRQLREDRELSNTPLVLLVNARDRLDPQVMDELGIEDQVRKPFEADNLREQVRKHLSENLPSALEADAGEPETLGEETPLFDEEMMSLISEAPGVAEDEATVPEIDFAADLKEPPEGQEDDPESIDLSLSDLPGLAAEAKALMQELAPAAESPYDDALEADGFGAHDSFFEDLPEPSQIIEKSAAPTRFKATEDSQGSRMTNKISASADDADLQLDEEVSATNGVIQDDEDFILDEDLELDDEIEADGEAAAPEPPAPEPEPESELGALERLRASGLEDQMARGQSPGGSETLDSPTSRASWGDASVNDDSFFESNLEETEGDAEDEAVSASEPEALEMDLVDFEEEDSGALTVSEDTPKEDEFVDLDLNSSKDVRELADEIDSAKQALEAEENALVEEAEFLEEAKEELKAEEAMVEEAVLLEEAEEELEAKKEVLIKNAEAQEEVEEELDAEKEALLEKAVLIKNAEEELEAAKGVLTKEETGILKTELEAEAATLVEEAELLEEVEEALQAEEAELLEEAEEALQAEEAALVEEAELLEEAGEELEAEEDALAEAGSLEIESDLEPIEASSQAGAEITEPNDWDSDFESVKIEGFEQNLDELDVGYSVASTSSEVGGVGGGGGSSEALASAAEMDTVLLDLTPEDQAHPPQDPRDQVILAETVEHVVDGPLTTSEDLDSFMEASSLEEMEADESLEEIGTEEERLIAKGDDAAEPVGEEEMLGKDALAELQSLTEEMAALEEQGIDTLPDLEVLPEEEDSAPGTFVEPPAAETFREVLTKEQESEAATREAAETAAAGLGQSAYEIADGVSQEEKVFANWEDAEEAFLGQERYSESPELELAGFGDAAQPQDTTTRSRGDLEAILTRLVSQSVEKTLQAHMPRGMLETAVGSLMQRSVVQALDDATPKIVEQIVQGIRDQSR